MWKNITLNQNPESVAFTNHTVNLRIRADVYPSFVEYRGSLYVSDGKGQYEEMIVGFHSFSAAEVILLNTNDEDDEDDDD